MNESELEKLSEKARRGRLTRDEEAQFRSHLMLHPGAQAAWEDEQAVNELLAQLPDAPMPSNFTARVLASVERESRAVSRPVRVRWTDWLAALSYPGRPLRVAFAATVICTGLLILQQHRAHKRTQVAESLSKFTRATDLPSVETLKDFEAITRLGQLAGAADMELLSQLPQATEK